MKYLPKNLMLFTALVTFTGPVLAQTPVTPSAGSTTTAPAPANPPVDFTTPQSSGTQAPPVQGQAPAPGTAPVDGSAPVTSVPVTSPKAPISWSTAALQVAVAKSVAESEKKAIKPVNKKAKLSDEAVKNLRSKIAKNEKDQKSRLKLAEHFLAIGKPDGAIEVLRPQVNTLNRAGILLLAQAYRIKKDHLQEVRTLDLQAEKTPNDYVIQHLLGDAYVKLGKKDDAFRFYSEARRLNSNYMPVYESLLREDKRSGQTHDAVTTAQDMVNTFGEKSVLLSELCLLYAHSAFLDKAQETCRQAISKSPKNPNNHVILGLVVKDKEGNAAAAKILEKAAKQFPKSEFAQYAAGELNWERKNVLAALDYFKKAVKIDKNSARAHLGLARAAFEEKKYQLAVDSFTQACLLDRTLIADFRKSAGLLRKKNDLTWGGRFNSGLGRCGHR